MSKFKFLSILSLLGLVFSGCASKPPASLVSWDGKQGKVRQGLWGPFYENKVDPEMLKIMNSKCPNGYKITKEGSDLTGEVMAEARFKEFVCK